MSRKSQGSGPTAGHRIRVEYVYYYSTAKNLIALLLFS